MLPTVPTQVLRVLMLATLIAVTCRAQAVTVAFQRVAEDVYVHVGDLGARSAENEGLNANIGLVVTPAGAVLVDSGATFESARQIHAAAARVSAQPIRWVINTGGQDHRWLGNGYFQAEGAELIAHADALPDMRDRGNDHLLGLQAVLGGKADRTVPTLPTRLITGADAVLELGGIRFEFRHRGGAHTPGDTVVWLPHRDVLFTGDVVYVDRLLGVIPVSRTRRWLETFAVIEDLRPGIVVPGHGRVTDLATAKADTQAYLVALRARMKRAVDDGEDVSAAVRRFDSAPFMRLRNAADLMPGNASRTYLEVERE